MLLSEWIKEGEKKEDWNKVTSVLAMFTDRKGFSKEYLLEFPTPSVFFVLEFVRPGFLFASNDVPPNLSEAKKVEFRLNGMSRHGFAFYDEV